MVKRKSTRPPYLGFRVEGLGFSALGGLAELGIGVRVQRDLVSGLTILG